MIINGDCLEEMKKMEGNSISSIVTDPPYGLGFMGKKWDAGLPQLEIWQEALRLCKPGAFLLAFGGTRTYHRLTCAIEDAGWEIRDCLQWIYGSGFPKSHNKFGLDGYGTALKPAYEPIIMAMKPLDGTFAKNAEKWEQAGINIEGCRIPTSDLKPYSPVLHRNSPSSFNDDAWKGKENIKEAPSGRWPANVIFDEEAGELLDEQSGISKSSGGKSGNINAYSGGFKHDYYGLSSPGLGDSGGASRFFYCAKASSSERNEGLEGLAKKEKGGCYGEFEGDGRGRQSEHQPMANHHPTVKPLKLMEYLIKLIMPPKDGLLLDPFCGSGTTLVAAKRLGVGAIGIEKSEDYCKIAEARLLHEVEKKEENTQLVFFQAG